MSEWFKNGEEDNTKGKINDSELLNVVDSKPENNIYQNDQEKFAIKERVNELNPFLKPHHLNDDIITHGAKFDNYDEEEEEVIKGHIKSRFHADKTEIDGHKKHKKEKRKKKKHKKKHRNENEEITDEETGKKYKSKKSKKHKKKKHRHHNEEQAEE